jgi:hypothetical protein
MDINLEKKLIIAELAHVEEEWLLRAIMKLLGLQEENEVPEQHRQVLDARLKDLDEDPSKLIDWEEAKLRLNRR